ncbi:MAG: tRNA (adenosine(37)-N6)-threonylcarbamoyltransferase complex dimerization subunit type 1 TsaB [Caulobacterales bacterium]
MLILAIDSALDALGVALVRDGATLAAAQERMSRGQAERIAPLAQEIAQQAEIKFAEIDRIVVTKGPGSFTGVRVGLAFARGLALSLSKPCVGISTLEALALEEGADGLKAAVIETPGALYIALYENGAEALAPRRCERAEVAELLTEAARNRTFSIRGPGAETWAPQIPGAEGVAITAPDPVRLAHLGATRDPALYRPDPMYLRPALI